MFQLRRKWLAMEMVHLDRLFLTFGVITAISLFATVVALTVQRFFETSPLLTLIGPIVAATTVVIYSKYGPGDEIGRS